MPPARRFLVLYLHRVALAGQLIANADGQS
jgi:hypothetical protein